MLLDSEKLFRVSSREKNGKRKLCGEVGRDILGTTDTKLTIL